MFLDNLILLFSNNEINNQFILIFLILSIITISLPIPYTFVIITNAYVFGWIGFLITFIAVPFGAILTFIVVKKLKTILIRFNFLKKIFNKNKLLENKVSLNIYFLIILRAILPFFLISVLMSTLKIKLRKYIFITMIGSLPNIFLITFLTNSLKQTIISYNEISIKWYDIRLLIAIILMITFVMILRKLKKTIKL